MVNAAEDPNITTGYTDYFPADGDQTTLTIKCVGAAEIQKCKESFLVNGRQLVVSLSLSLLENCIYISCMVLLGRGTKLTISLTALPQHNFCGLKQRKFYSLRGPGENGADVPCANQQLLTAIVSTRRPFPMLPT